MSDATGDDAPGRANQRKRTRAAIVAATMDLLAEGPEPSMSEIADAAQVSRRTLYLHFPSLDQLLVDAAVGALSQHAVDEAIESADPGGTDADTRVAAMIGALADQAAATLPLGRRLIRLTIDAPPAEDGDDGRPRRGYRRVGWIEQALAPLHDRLGDDGFERLVSGLAMVVGWEALIVLGDVRGLDAGQQQDTTLWAARALIAAALAEASAPT